MPAAISIFDTEMRFILVSDQFAAIKQMSVQDLIGKRLYDILPNLPENWKDTHKKGLEGKHLTREDDIFRRTDGTLEWWRSEVLPWYKEVGGVGGIILFVEDVTKRKTMEKKMKEMIENLNKSNEDLERFAHICAHDLNEPLRTIGGYCHILEKEFKENLPPLAKEYLQNITSGVKQLGDLIQGLLTYSEVGEKGLKKEPCSAQDIVKSVTMLLEGRIIDKNALIEYDSLPTVNADKVLLTQVFQNLISNALKFNESDQPKIRITSTEKKNYFTFTVEDNGIGIDRKNYKIIFDLFKRLHTRSRYKGAGIGLAFCKKIIEAHGGEISVKSSPNKGSVFSFTLPKEKCASLRNKKLKIN